jgi:IS4 transposase
MSTKPETLEFAKYVVVFTTRYSGSAAEILEWYRMRWQIELEFKRLKSLVQLGHLPKHDDRSSRLAARKIAGRPSHAKTDR